MEVSGEPKGGPGTHGGIILVPAHLLWLFNGGTPYASPELCHRKLRFPLIILLLLITIITESNVPHKNHKRMLPNTMIMMKTKDYT